VKLLPLTKGKVALVDDGDFERTSRFKWTAMEVKRALGSLWYVRRCIRLPDGRQHSVLLHRFILEAPANFEVDHVNGDALDNRRSNLRLATPSQNRVNRRGKARPGTSRYLGVMKPSNRKRWEAFVHGPDGKNHRGGSFDLEEDAARARDELALRLWGDRARLNFSRA